jgi:hypothetical protein
MAIMARGEIATKIEEEAYEKGRKDANKNKEIIGEVSGLTKGATGKGGQGFTQADKDFAEKHGRTLEDARKIRLSREKAAKESKEK